MSCRRIVASLLPILLACQLVAPAPAGEQRSRVRRFGKKEAPATTDASPESGGGQNNRKNEPSSPPLPDLNPNAGTAQELDFSPMVMNSKREADDIPFTTGESYVNESYESPYDNVPVILSEPLDDALVEIITPSAHYSYMDTLSAADASPPTAPADLAIPAELAAPAVSFRDSAGSGVYDAGGGAIPSREEVETYRRRLENRLLERYNNMPEYAGKVAKVTVVLSKPLRPSLDGTLLRAEFDQLVYDNWGKRLPVLEKEYYVITFGSDGVQQVRSDPSIRVGLDLEKTYSERAPLAADPFRRVPEDNAFRPAPMAKMPEWWRPEFRDED